MITNDKLLKKEEERKVCVWEVKENMKVIIKPHMN